VGGNLNKNSRSKMMQIRFDQEMGTYLYFPPNEIKVALGVLKAIYKVCGAEFLLVAITDIEIYLKPPKLPFTLSTRICEKCFCEVDIKSDNAVHYTGDQDKWLHRTCPTLKENRPV
jgi:hypothetical protein